MDPFTIFAISQTFNAGTNLINGMAQRAHQKKLQTESHDFQRTLHEQTRQDTFERFIRDMSFRRDELLFRQTDAVESRRQQVALALQQWAQQRRLALEARSHSKLLSDFTGSVDGWESDPLAKNEGDIPSLRVLLQLPPELDRSTSNDIQRTIATEMQNYMNVGDGDYHILFPTNMLEPKTREGSWLAAQLSAWNMSIPTLILRLSETQERIDLPETFSRTQNVTFQYDSSPAHAKNWVILADMFGFPIGPGGSYFKTDVSFGTIPNDPALMGDVLSFLAQYAADMYFTYGHAKAPLLPKILPDYMPANGEGVQELISNLVTSYQDMVFSLIEEMPQLGIPATIQLADSFASLPDKSHAAALVESLEKVATDLNLFGTRPDLAAKLSDLYTLAGKPEVAKRLEALGNDVRQRLLTEEAKKQERPVANYDVLKKLGL